MPVHPDRGLYDLDVLRTFFLELPAADWEEELADFYRTGVEVPADLVVDGTRYAGIGVRFRGNSSFFGVRAGKKRSLSFSIDYSERGGRLDGRRTVEFLNSHADPSFLRAVLYSYVHGRYAPAQEANLVKLVINGESWGIYVNVEQYSSGCAPSWATRSRKTRGSSTRPRRTTDRSTSIPRPRRERAAAGARRRR